MTLKSLPYGRQSIDEDDIAAVTAVLRSDWLTTGPAVGIFEQTVAEFVGAKHAVAVSNGTAALHAAMFALEVGAGDEVIVPPMTFAATANCVLYQGGTPIFADVEQETLLLDPARVQEKVTPRTKVISAVDYAGQPADYDRLRDIAARNNLAIVADGCHALGAAYKGRKVGTLADLTVFSFHPVKHITTGEGGMIATDDARLASRMRAFRNHGITTDHRERAAAGAWYYEMVSLGYNYRLSDLQCALGTSQLRRLPEWIARRQEIAAAYDRAFEGNQEIRPLLTRTGNSHAYHLYVVRVEARDAVFAALRAGGIGANVHYIPVHLHPYYRERFDTKPGMCPVAEETCQHILSLPMFPQMTDTDVARVVGALELAVRH